MREVDLFLKNDVFKQTTDGLINLTHLNELVG